jgi:hypothetical protein
LALQVHSGSVPIFCRRTLGGKAILGFVPKDDALLYRAFPPSLINANLSPLVVSRFPAMRRGLFVEFKPSSLSTLSLSCTIHGFLLLCTVAREMNSSTSAFLNRISFPTLTHRILGSFRVAWACTQSTETCNHSATSCGHNNCSVNVNDPS